MADRCCKQKRNPLKVAREVGRLLGQNSRAAGLFDVDVRERKDGGSELVWNKVKAWRDWSELSEGCYLLRTNVADWSDEELWKAYIQLTEAEAAFRIHKSDLSIRPIWHQKKDRVLAHILVCFLAYVLWKTLASLCERAGLGNEPRRVFRRDQRDPRRRRRASHTPGSRNPPALRHQAERTSGNPTEKTGPAPTITIKNVRNVVKTFQPRPLQANHLRQQLSKLG